MLRRLKPLADYNITGALVSLMNTIMKPGPAAEFGGRHIILSSNPMLIEGFSLNKKITFDMTVHAALDPVIDRKALAAWVDIPALNPGENFIPQSKHTYYSFVATLGIFPDLYGSKDGYEPASCYEYLASDVVSPWYETKEGNGPITLELGAPFQPPDNAFTLVLGIGLQYGAPKPNGEIKRIKDTGCAKILRAG